MSLTVDIAGFIGSVTLDAVPRDVRHIASRSILDGLGLAVAGSRGHAAELARAEIASYGLSSREATVLGTDMHVPAQFAAFLNGLAIHADDFDDTQLAERPDRVYGLLMHPTAPVLAAVLAIGERAEIDGSQLLLAYLLGTEVACKVAEAIDPRHYGDGFHSTATIGTIGAAAGSARLLGLDRTTTAVALSLGASQAAGLRENFGTMTKPFHAGRAAEGGVLAASLARAGFTATTAGLEAPRGFFKAAGGGFRPHRHRWDPRGSLDVRVAWHLDQATSLRIAHAPCDGRRAGSGGPRGPATFRRGKCPHRHEPAHAERLDPARITGQDSPPNSAWSTAWRS